MANYGCENLDSFISENEDVNLGSVLNPVDAIDVDLQQFLDMNSAQDLMSSCDDQVNGQAGTVAAGTSNSQAQPAVVDFPPCPPSTPGSVSAVDTLPGQYAFSVTVDPWGGAPKGHKKPYFYNPNNDKLYLDVLRAVPFLFKFEGVHDPTDFQIRAQLFYGEAQHQKTPVRRCAMHRDAKHPSNVNGQLTNHVLRVHPSLRSNVPRPRYEEQGEWCSVIVPLEPLNPVTGVYEVIFELACLNTCAGGSNRRVKILFTLEDRRSGSELGKLSQEVKVCSCPFRDFENDEKKRTSALPAARCTRKQPESSSVRPSDDDRTNRPKRPKRSLEASPPPSPASSSEDPGVGQLVVQADDEDMYRCLLGVRDYVRRLKGQVADQYRTRPSQDQ